MKKISKEKWRTRKRIEKMKKKKKKQKRRIKWFQRKNEDEEGTVTRNEKEGKGIKRKYLKRRNFQA